MSHDQQLDNAQVIARHAIDLVAATNILAIVAGLIPVIAGLLSIAWFLYQIYDLYDRRRRAREKDKSDG